MQVGDYFKINIPRNGESEIIYRAVIVSDNSEWVSAKIIYPRHIAEKLKSEGIFKIHIASLDISILGNPEKDPIIEAIYG